MSKHRNKIFYELKNNVQEKKTCKEYGNIKMQTDEEIEKSVSESQNFCLKLSPNSTICDTQDVIANNEKDTIVISDSSSSCCSFKHSPELKFTYNKHFTINKEVYVVDSSDSSDTQEDRFFQTWRKKKKHNLSIRNWERKNVNRNNTLFISDDTSSDSSESCKRYIQNTDKTSNSYINSSPDNIKSGSNTITQVYSTTVNKRNLISSSDVCSNSSKSVDQPSQVSIANNNDNNNLKKQFTRKDARNIIKNIKSSRLVYESPRREKNLIIDESINSDLHPAVSPKNNLKINNKIIDETVIDSESDVIQGSEVNVTNLYKNHISRFLDAPHASKDEGTICMELSERKKRQISTWLMTNSPDSKSDNSIDIVPASNKDDFSSGNSSLERLEMNYETPNNRGKIQHIFMNEKITNQDCNKITQPVVSQQITLHESTQLSRTNVLQLPASKDNHTNNIFSTPTIHKPQNIDVMDCADILDKLYGASWREKANILFPKSEPRKHVISTRNRAVQTERKKRNGEKVAVTDSNDDGSNMPLKDLKAQISSTKKATRKNVKQKCSFINDESSSESGCETSYYTALTNPRLSTIRVKSKSTVPSIVQRGIAIYDTDTESEGKKNNSNEDCKVRGKKLLFSDDESEHSSTSEFDPGDDIPLKPKTKKDPIQISRNISKINSAIKSIGNRKYEKHNSFLASLSENVPIANVHPNAKRYRVDYKNSKENLCNHLYKLYNENVFDNKLPKDMLIEWSIRMRGSAGFCYNKKSLKTLGGVVRSSRIVLATKVLDTPDRLRDTLIHEMCHAAAWLINDVSDGHGPFWTGWANKAMKTFPELPPIRRCHDYKIKTKFTYKCVSCGYSIGRHSKSLDIEKKRCGHCYGKFELLLNKTTKSGIVQVRTPKKELTGFALYVKENYNVVKKKHNKKHAEVMKILGQQFSAIKIVNKPTNLENDPGTPG
ncbi:uncharacterized protein LOC143151112 [Ptiloglossa arizonensis]|uniref:uncharacterized protein LOC143151112 n=1 Tax=Ptiloglossa arizonensis TaxID=3350558 RepID=UPI003FA1501B